MAKKKIAAGTILGLGAIGFGIWYFMRDASAATPGATTIDPSDGPGGLGPIIAVPGQPPGPIITGVPVLDPITGVPVLDPIQSRPMIFDPGVFAGSDFECERAGHGFNIAQWSLDPAIGPPRVAAAMTLLGFPIGEPEILATDKVRAESRRIWNVPFVNPKRSDTVRSFQALARSLNLPGLGGGLAAGVDGIMGECSLIALSEAASLYNAGQWPGPP